MLSHDLHTRNRRLGTILIGVFILLFIGAVIGAITLNWNASWRVTPGGW